MDFLERSEKFVLIGRLVIACTCLWEGGELSVVRNCPTQLWGVRPGRGEPSCVHVTLTFPPQEIDFWLIIHLAEETLRRINHISSQKLLKLLSSSNLAYCKGLKRGCEANWWLVLLFFWGLLILVPAGSPLEMWSKYQCFQSSQSDTWTARDNPRIFDSEEGKHAHVSYLIF